MAWRYSTPRRHHRVNAKPSTLPGSHPGPVPTPIRAIPGRAAPTSANTRHPPACPRRCASPLPVPNPGCGCFCTAWPAGNRALPRRARWSASTPRCWPGCGWRAPRRDPAWRACCGPRWPKSAPEAICANACSSCAPMSATGCKTPTACCRWPLMPRCSRPTHRPPSCWARWPSTIATPWPAGWTAGARPSASAASASGWLRCARLRRASGWTMRSTLPTNCFRPTARAKRPTAC